MKATDPLFQTGVSRAYRVSYSKLNGVIQAPPSKSQTLRSVLFATMAEGQSQIDGPLISPDVKAMVTACRQLGAAITQEERGFKVVGVSGKPILPDDVIDAGNSGQVLRFIAAIAALIDGYVVLTGDHSLRYNRPIQPLLTALSKLGATCVTLKGDAYAPVIIKGPMLPGYTDLDGADSQPVSGLLIAAAWLPGRTEIHVHNPGELPWIHLTLNWFDKLGIAYKKMRDEHYVVQGNAAIKGFKYPVPGDFSSLIFPLVAALLTQSTIVIAGVDINDCQGDKAVIGILQTMGAKISEDSGRLSVAISGRLHNREIDVNDMIDALPILAVVGCYADGEMILKNAGIARKKESDRLRAITTELKKMGADIDEYSDALVIRHSKLHGAKVNSHQDHRIAMALTVAALGCEGVTQVSDIDCIQKSYPDFYQAMCRLGAKIEWVD